MVHADQELGSDTESFYDRVPRAYAGDSVIEQLHNYSNSLDTAPCIEALEEALAIYGLPKIFNSDQGCQLTSEDFTDVLKAHGIKISMEGKGR